MGHLVEIASAKREHSTENFSEEKFRLAVEACPSGMVISDSLGRIVLVNSATESLFDYRREELVGQRLELLIPERFRGEHLRQRAVFAAHPQPRRAQPNRELFGLRRDGHEFPVEVWLNPISTAEGLFVLSVIIDISQRKRIDRLKDEFVSTVSHELRTPLTSISGSLGLLLGGAAGKLPETAVRLLTIAQTNSKRLVRLINDILDIQKIESGQIAFNFKRVDVRALAEQVIETNRAYADGFGVRIRLVPDTSAAEVPADPDRLAQVITNLLSNAVKFSPHGGDVDLSIAHYGARVRISVRDHGDGIRAAFKPRVFEKFAQADATDARQKGGTGLGLSIVREIVARLNGTVGFEDADGGGTVFWVELPAWEQVAIAEFDGERTPDLVRILFCEDDPEASLALRDGLRQFGYSVDFAHNPDDAIARARSNVYAAIVVDFELPDAGGVDFIRRLRQQPESYKTPIVITSGERRRAREETPDLNVLKWIVKPVDSHELLQVLSGTVARGANGRPSILHVDDDHDVLDLVARALEGTARVISVDSIEKARESLLLHHFDLAVLDIALGSQSGLNLLPELRNRKGAAIPVIVFSGNAAKQGATPQVEAQLSKSGASLDDLVAAVHDRLMLRSSRAQGKPP